jgi:KUP system potassium uptake protein
MTANTPVPNVLLHHLKHNKVLHERVVLMSFRTVQRPEVEDADRVSITPLDHGFYRDRRLGLHAEAVDGPTPGLSRTAGLVSINAASVANEYIFEISDCTRFASWRKKLFVIMSRNAPSITAYIGIPPNRVIEIGTQVEL